MKTQILGATLCFLVMSFALPVFSSEEPVPSGQFEMKTIDRHRKVGLVTVKKNSKNSKVELEGSGLKRGKYALYVSRYCQPQKKGKNPRKKAQWGQQVLDFTTQSGELWVERSLQQAADLPLHQENQPFVFLLVKVNKSGREVVATSLCAKLDSVPVEPVAFHDGE